MSRACLIGRKQAKHAIDRHAVGGVEFDRLFQSQEHRDRPRQPGDPRMRYRDTTPESGAAQRFAFEDTFKNMRRIKRIDVGKTIPLGNTIGPRTGTVIFAGPCSSFGQGASGEWRSRRVWSALRRVP